MKPKRAIVVGGGFAGLVAARVLSDYFESVTVLEKDPLVGATQPRPGAAQGAHLHVLLQRGQDILRTLFPGIENDFTDCPSIDWAADTEWETASGRFPRYLSGIRTLSMSRPLLEGTLFSRVSQRSNVTFSRGQLGKIEIRSGRVTQFECVDQSKYDADFFVLAGGQYFPLQRLLKSIPFEEQTLPIHITYRSAVFKTNTLTFGNYKQFYHQFSPPHDSSRGNLPNRGRAIHCHPDRIWHCTPPEAQPFRIHEVSGAGSWWRICWDFEKRCSSERCFRFS